MNLQKLAGTMVMHSPALPSCIAAGIPSTLCVAKQFGHAPVGEFAQGTRCYQTRRVVVCRRPADFLAGVCPNSFAILGCLTLTGSRDCETGAFKIEMGPHVKDQADTSTRLHVAEHKFEMLECGCSMIVLLLPK